MSHRAITDPLRRLAGGAASVVEEAGAAVRALRSYRQFPPGLVSSGLVRYSPHGGFTTPVLLVHGAGHNDTAWGELGRRLHAAGFPCLFTMRYDFRAQPVSELAEELGRRVEDVLQATGTDRLHVVGHSLGGVATRVWHDLGPGGPLLASAVTLGSPHAGAPAAVPFATPTPLRVLRPGSRFIRELDAAGVDHADWTTIAGGADFIVPPSFTRLKGARAITVAGVGHVGLLYSPTVAGEVCFALLGAEERRAGNVA